MKHIHFFGENSSSILTFRIYDHGTGYDNFKRDLLYKIHFYMVF